MSLSPKMTMDRSQYSPYISDMNSPLAFFLMFFRN